MRNRDKDDHLLIKAAQVWPFVDTVARRHGPVVSLCRRAGLSLQAVRKKRGVVGERSAWRFIDYASRHLRLEHLGYLAAVEHPVNSTGELGGLRVRMAPTLGKLLEFFIDDVRAESTGTFYSLRHDGERTWFHREPIFRDSDAGWQTEQYVIMFVVQIVRLCAGLSWLPSKLRLASSSRPRRVPDEWSGIDTEWGCSATELAIDDWVLGLPSGEASSDPGLDNERRGEDDKAALDIEHLVDRQIWSGHTSLADAADEVGLSVTTLKRRLRETGKTYSGVLSNRRQYWAERMLSEPTPSIGDIAKTLGYKHYPNFARAFARQTGSSPRAFRRGALSSADRND